MTFFFVAVSEVCTQCICCHIILTLHHFLSHVVIVFEPCILFCLVVTSAIELFTLSLWLSPASSCFTLKGSFLHITSRHTKEHCLDRGQSRSSLSNVRLDETKSRFGITLEGGQSRPFLLVTLRF